MFLFRLLRKIPDNWFGLLFLLVGVAGGLKLIDPKHDGNTSLCFDSGCVTIQGYTILVVCVVGFCWLVYLEAHRQIRMRKKRLRQKDYNATPTVK